MKIRFGPSVLAILRRLYCDNRGVSAVEFALLCPLLLIVFGFVVESSRMFMTYQKFGQAVDGLSRSIVRYPEYELRTRLYAPYFADMLMPPEWRDNLDVKVISLKKTSGKMEVLFSHVLFGNDPGTKWEDEIDPAIYVENENVVLIASSYRYNLIYNIFSTLPLTFSSSYQILPFFSREFVWNDGQVDNKYVY